MSDLSGPRWYRSLYWRIGLGLFAFLALMLAAQGALFLWTTDRIAGSMPARFTAWAMTCPPMSAPWVRLKTPRTALPMGVRAVETMTASTMGRSFSFRSVQP